MHCDKNICQSVKTVRGNCKESWESYHRINIRQKTMMMIMLMMPVISTLLHHRLRARSVFEECAWGFSFREEGNAIQQRKSYPHTRQILWWILLAGDKNLGLENTSDSVYFHLILWQFFYKRGIMVNLFFFQSWIKRPWHFQWRTRELWSRQQSSLQIQIQVARFLAEES